MRTDKMKEKSRVVFLEMVWWVEIDKSFSASNCAWDDDVFKDGMCLV
jgi:hypothetical protein